jgi:hypothetical protein
MTRTANRNRIGLVLILICLLTTIASGPATSVVLDTTAGPYDISIGASPTPLVVGRNHISILVQDRLDRRIVTDAVVTVTGKSLEAPTVEGDVPVFQHPATHDQAADERQYGTAVVFDTPGRWQLTIHIDGPAGAATTSVQLTVQRKLPALPLVYFMMILIPLTAVALIIYWFRSGERTAAAEGS